VGGRRRGSVTEKDAGAMDRAKGLIKEAAGKLTGDETREAEGRSEREEDATEGNREYFRNLIKESKERSGL
jgi:hypothetical protein